MNDGAFRAARMAAAAVVIGGGLAIAFPQHAPSFLRLVIATLAAVAGLHALAVLVPPTGWLSPFRWWSPFHPTSAPRRPSRSDETRAIRDKLGGWRQPVAGAPPLPPDTVRLLKPLIRSALDLGPRTRTVSDPARERLSQLTRAILDHEPPTRRPVWAPAYPPNTRAVANVVHRVLDELDAVDAHAVDTSRPLDFHPPRAS